MSNIRKEQNEKLKNIKKCCNKANWNSYNAKPIRIHTLKVAKKILNNFIVTPEVFPVPNGNIQFEFEFMNNYLEFELVRKNKKEYKLEWIKMIDNEVYSNGIISSRDYEKMNQIVKDFFPGKVESDEDIDKIKFLAETVEYFKNYTIDYTNICNLHLKMDLNDYYGIKEIDMATKRCKLIETLSNKLGGNKNENN